jgi:predicted CXXCH cytochrome family protein
MTRGRAVGILAVALFAAVSVPGLARASVVDTRHNLSATGTGRVRAGTTEVCAFCHTPHRAATTRALWSRDLPSITYTLYTSSTFDATAAQPTGATRLCLSCHDGTTALGLVRTSSGRRRISSLGPITGRANLGTDLSDDHPVSFEYTTALSRAHGQLADPATLSSLVPLDTTRQLQCTTCHDAHENRFRAFLRLDDRGGALCIRCHQLRNFPGSTHASSTATWNKQGTNPWPTTPFTTVANNACENCHRPHTAPHPVRLLAQPEERNVCLVCHNGNVARTNIEAEFAKASVHPIVATDGVHDPTEDPRTMARHVTCVDCHNPHQVIGSSASPPSVSGRLRGVSGVNLGGQVVAEAAFEYEVCFKCHGLRDQTVTHRAVRVDNTRNVRLEFSLGNASFHPVPAAGRNPTASIFDGGFSAGSLIYCTDCHNTDGPRGLPRGPHGSRFEPILERNFRLTEPTSESPDSYALCYKCHSRTVLLSSQPGKFPHDKHLINAKASCGFCHDAHGSRLNPHLINFMLRDPNGTAVVTPTAVQKLIRYDTPRPGGGPGSGQCFVQCHGVNHEPFQYGS